MVLQVCENSNWDGLKMSESGKQVTWTHWRSGRRKELLEYVMDELRRTVQFWIHWGIIFQIKMHLIWRGLMPFFEPKPNYFVQFTIDRNVSVGYRTNLLTRKRFVLIKHFILLAFLLVDQTETIVYSICDFSSSKSSMIHKAMLVSNGSDLYLGKQKEWRKL